MGLANQERLSGRAGHETTAEELKAPPPPVRWSACYWNVI